jgi:hypothetical protein
MRNNAHSPTEDNDEENGGHGLSTFQRAMSASRYWARVMAALPSSARTRFSMVEEHVELQSVDCVARGRGEIVLRGDRRVVRQRRVASREPCFDTRLPVEVRRYRSGMQAPSSEADARSMCASATCRSRQPRVGSGMCTPCRCVTKLTVALCVVP